MQSGDNDDGWLANIEEEYLQAIDAEPDYERQYSNERDSSIQKVWGSFQESATSIALLYKERLTTNDTGALWLPFQTAAGTVTTLYKESCDGAKRTNELAIQCGYQRRTRELADWAKNKRRRYIRREELLSYLAGKPPPPIHVVSAKHNHLNHHHHNNSHSNNNHHHNHHHHHHVSPKQQQQQQQQSIVTTQHDNGGNNGAAILFGHQHNLNYHQQTSDDSTELHTFKEALVRRPRGPELYAFVADEIERHCKRPASPLSIDMDVQHSSKRQRFL